MKRSRFFFVSTDISHQSLCYAILIHRGSNIIGLCLYLIRRIAHSHTDTGIAKHRYIISSIPKSNCLFLRNSITGKDMLNTDSFIYAQWNDIREVRMPTGSYAMGHDFHNIFLLFGIKKSNKLIYRCICKLIDITDFGSLYPHQIIDSLGNIIHIINANLIVQHTSTGERLYFLLIFQHSLKVIR